MDRQEFKNYLSKNKRPFMANFYKIVRTKMNLLMNKNGSPKGNKWSFDEENRKKLPNDIKIPKISEMGIKPRQLENRPIPGEEARPDGDPARQPPQLASHRAAERGGLPLQADRVDRAARARAGSWVMLSRTRRRARRPSGGARAQSWRWRASCRRSERFALSTSELRRAPTTKSAKIRSWPGTVSRGEPAQNASSASS